MYMAKSLYAYNGVIMPELVWDKTNYPFAATFITTKGENNGKLFFE